MKSLFVLVILITATTGQRDAGQNPGSRNRTPLNRIHFEEDYRSTSPGRQRINPRTLLGNQERSSELGSDLTESTSPSPLRTRHNNDLVLTISENGAHLKQQPSKTEQEANFDRTQSTRQDLENQFNMQPLYKPVCFLTPVRNFLRIPQKTVIDHSIQPAIIGNTGEIHKQKVIRPEEKSHPEEQKNIYDPNEKVAIDPRIKVVEPVKRADNQNGVSSRSRSVSFDDQFKTEALVSSDVGRRHDGIKQEPARHVHSVNPFLIYHRHK